MFLQVQINGITCFFFQVEGQPSAVIKGSSRTLHECTLCCAKMRPTHGVLAYQKLGPRSNAAATATGARKLIGTEIRCSSHCYCNYCSRLQQRAPFPRGTLTNIKILSPLLWNSTLELPKHTLLKTNVQSALFFFAGTDKAQIERNMKTQMLKWLRASAWTRKKKDQSHNTCQPIAKHKFILSCPYLCAFPWVQLS